MNPLGSSASAPGAGVRIPHSRPCLGPREAEAAAAAIRGGWVAEGPALDAFEAALARRLERSGAVAVSSGSAALHLAIRAMGIGPGHEVAVPSYTCVSVLQAVRRAGAEPVPVDCDPALGLMDPGDLRRRCSGRTRAVVLVHAFGMPAPVEEYLDIGPPVIEDVATALGARLRGRPSGAYGGCAVASFHATKLITTGRGGAVAADDPSLLERVLDLVRYDARDDAGVRYNERLSALAAAVGSVQLERLDTFLQARSERASRYAALLAAADAEEKLVLPAPRPGAEPAWHRFVVRIPGGSDPVRAHLEATGIASPRPVHQPLHRILGRDGYPGAEALHTQALSLPIYPDLSLEEVSLVAREVLACLNGR